MPDVRIRPHPRKPPNTTDSVHSRPNHPTPSLGTPSTHGFEQQLSAVQSQLDLLKAQVRQAQQLAELGTAAATIAHEVNNLLTPILSYAQSALERGDEKLSRKALELTMKHGRMLTAMSNRVLRISAASATHPETVKVKDAVEEARESLCRDLSKDGIRFINQVGEEVTVRADALHLQQVLFNLFLNAREAMAREHQGLIRVSATRHGERVDISIHNSGTPIPRELLGHVFESLQSSKPADTDGKRRCSGLGLALCKDLIEENHGRIGITGSDDAGTTFLIELPTADTPK